MAAAVAEKVDIAVDRKVGRDISVRALDIHLLRCRCRWIMRPLLVPHGDEIAHALVWCMVRCSFVSIGLVLA